MSTLVLRYASRVGPGDGREPKLTRDTYAFNFENRSGSRASRINVA
jgi:hypothetical protein